jgi:hypothetical protein
MLSLFSLSLTEKAVEIRPVIEEHSIKVSFGM